MLRALYKSSTGRPTALLAAAALAAGACSDFEVAPEEVTASEAPPTPGQLAAHVPTFDIAADAGAFAEMMARYGEDVEIDAAVTMWRGAGEVLSAEPAELQIRGNASAAFPLKSLGVKLDDDFDNAAGDLLRVPAVLPGHSLAALRNFRLRNGGNDFVFTLLKDLGYARMVAASDLRVVPIYGEPAAAFVNGEFYGLLNLRTEGNANGVSRLTGIRKRELLLAEINNGEGRQPFEVKRGDTAVFRGLEAAIAAGDRPAAMSAIDEEGFIDFVLVHTLLGVNDWPWNNVKVYGRTGEPLRFLAFDFDLAAEHYPDRGLLFHVRERKANYISDLFELAYADAGFRDRFWDRRDELLAGEALRPERLRENFEALAATYEPIIGHQIAKYGHPASEAAWYLGLEAHVEAYARRYRLVQSEDRE